MRDRFSSISGFSGRNRQIRGEEEEEEEDQVSVLDLLVAVFRKSLVGCSSTTSGAEEKNMMEIGWPTNVKHVVYVTFDRFNGFLGLPVEFEPQVPRRPPSASTRVFGVSTESMQLSFDSRGNCVPAILLMMQQRLYSQGGLKMEGIFRINPENSREEYVREQLNNGVIPDDIDVHCLAGLIKAWFRELPTGVIDSLSIDHVMQARSEDEYSQLVRQLAPTEAALLDWSINLMADVVTMEHLNKMNARNIALVFAPNMTQSNLKNVSRGDIRANTKCKLLHWCVDELIVAEGRVASTDPNTKVHHVVLGGSCWKVWVDKVLVENVDLIRSNDEIQFLDDAIGSTVAWLSKFIVLCD